MRSPTPMKVAKTGYIVLSILLCALGILLICKPNFSLTVFGIAAGVCLVLFGIFKIVGYFSRDLYRLAFQYDLAFGILCIALGVMVILIPADVIQTICIAIGIGVLMDGLLKIQISIDSKRFGILQWWMILGFGHFDLRDRDLYGFPHSGHNRGNDGSARHCIAAGWNHELDHGDFSP